MSKLYVDEAKRALKRAGFDVESKGLILYIKRKDREYTLMVNQDRVSRVGLSFILGEFNYNINGFPINLQP